MDRHRKPAPTGQGASQGTGSRAARLAIVAIALLAAFAGAVELVRPGDALEVAPGPLMAAAEPADQCQETGA